MSTCPWTLEDCAIWLLITERFKNRIHRAHPFAVIEMPPFVQRMRDTFHQGDRRDYALMSNAQGNPSLIAIVESRWKLGAVPIRIPVRGPWCRSLF